MLICWFINTSLSLKDVNITQQVVAIYPQPSAGYKPKPTVRTLKALSHSAMYYVIDLKIIDFLQFSPAVSY